MKLSLVSLLAGSAAAFAPAPSDRASVALNNGMDDLRAIAEKSNPVLKFYDPLELSSVTIWGNTNDESIAFLRQAEIKHGRVAMAAFVGYIVQSNGIHFPWPMSFDGTPFPYDAGSPPEQWDALSDPAKWQIILFVGFLEWYSESQGTHYIRGGTPGAYPRFSDSDVVPHPVPFDLYDPFGWSKGRSAEARAEGLIKELNNGRLAMIGIMGFISEQRLEGSVPLLRGLVAHYDGETMAPFM